MKKKTFLILIFIMILLAIFTVINFISNKDEQIDIFIGDLEKEYKPIYIKSTESSWKASITGKKEDFDEMLKAQNDVTNFFANKEYFERLKKFKESGNVKDSLLNRQLTVLYNYFLGAQVDTAKLTAINQLANEIEQKYNNFRAEINGKQLTDNQIEDLLSSSKDSRELETAWLGHKKIGSLVAEDVKKIVRMRNEVAKEIGFNNYHEMSLKLSEQDPEQILKLFDELDNLTKDAFVKEKNIIDEYFSKRYNVPKDKLMPWHYQNRFFQEAPKIYEIDLDVYYKDKDLVKLTDDFYKGISLPVDDIIKNSDLFEKPGKNQHAYCTDINKNGDVRVLCNVKPNEKWMNTMLHEYGHGIYSKYTNRELPFFLRDAAHTFTTEAIAQIFGRFSSNAYWMKDMNLIKQEDVAKISEIAFSSLRLQQLVFSRWSQVMYRFEKAMYENPEQDLNKLWWELVEKYQLLKKPEGKNEPDWASKIHIALYPCYYHNYHLGELLASQLYFYICDNILKTKDYKTQSFVGKPEIGAYLKEKIFMPGAEFYWDDMIQKATGEKLTAKYYAKQFVE